MSTRNAHWYSRNAGRKYPLDDAATGEDDQQVSLPSAILTDMQLRWPSPAGSRAFLSAVSLTPHLVTLTIQAAAGPSGPALAPLAALSLPRPVLPGHPYVLQPQNEGVVGWVVFGPGVQEEHQARFSQPRQALLSPRAARPYRKLPLTGVVAADAEQPLTGLVRLRALEPLRLSVETRDIDGVARRCLVLSLDETRTSSGAFLQPESVRREETAARESLLERFAGPCGKRPESRNCGEPQPIEFVNGVGPDCDGVLTLRFRNCARVGRLTDRCGVVLDCNLGLRRSCPPKYLPDHTGRLPSEYDPLVLPYPPDVPSSFSEPPFSESSVLLGTLPYTHCFSEDSPSAFDVYMGAWNVQADNDHPDLPAECAPPSSLSASLSDWLRLVYASNSVAGENLSVWHGFDTLTVGRRYTTSIKMRPGPSGSANNGFLAFNVKPAAPGSQQRAFLFAGYDRSNQRLVLGRHSGSGTRTLEALAQPNLALDRWYGLEVSVVAAAGRQANVTVRFYSLFASPNPLDVTLGPVLVANYRPAEGSCGFYTIRALTSFGFLRIEEI